MNKKNNKAITLFSLLTVLIAFFISPITSFAATVNYEKVANYISTWHVKSLGGLHWTDDGIHLIKADNHPAFCIEHGTILNGGSGFTPSELTIAEKERLSLIAYYGYQINPTIDNYGITQNLVWLEFGDELLTTNIPNFDNRRNEILNQVKNHSIKPTFNNQTINLKVGESTILEDKNNVLSKYVKQLSNSANLKIEKNGNKLKLTATKDSKESGTIKYSIADSNSVGQSFVYAKPNEQKVATFKLSNAGEFNLNVKVKLNGNIKVKKIDKDTGKPLPNAKLKFEYNNQTKEVMTDSNGLAQINDITQGTTVTISEVTAPDGFFNQGELKKVIVEPNKTIEVTLDNKPQKGQLSLIKKGKVPVGIEKKETEYGDLYEFKFDYQSLAGVTYDIQATEDIKVGSTIHAKKGVTIATVVTGDDGELIDMPLLYLGKYQAIEKSAPDGFIIDSTPIPFEFTYQEQTIELVSESLSATNEFQKIKLTLHKSEEVIKEWKDNLPVLDVQEANGKVFGLYTNQTMSFADQELPQDSLINYGTVKEGLLTLDELQYPEGNYYFKELDSGTDHDLNPNKYPFSFKAEDNDSLKEITIYESPTEEGSDIPILNKLHFNEFRIKKTNEQATLKNKNGYEFNYDGLGTGAEFTLEDEDGKVLQTVSIDKESIGTFSNIPVGTFYLKEKSPSSDHYLPVDSIIQITSTKEGIKATDTDGKTIGEQLSENEETPILLDIKNDLIKGSAELTKKDVSTGEILPNTEIRILDENKNCIIEGKTDEKGIFAFKELPKGIYYFQEFGAPQGYQLDETPVKFEIKEHGKVVKCEMTNKRTETNPLPQTGESHSPLLLGIGIALSLSALAFIGVKKVKKSKETNN